MRQKVLICQNLLQFCDDNNFFLSSQMLLLADGFTYVSEAWHTSFFDHCISTADAHPKLYRDYLQYVASISDHLPFMMTLDIQSSLAISGGEMYSQD